MEESYARGPDYELTTKTTDQVLRDTVARHADHEALVARHQNIRLTWGELANEVDRTARGLVGLGLAPGAPAGVWATSCSEWIYLQLAVVRAGLVQVKVNPSYPGISLASVLPKSAMKALILRAQDA